jgi:hypothetical protein
MTTFEDDNKSKSPFQHPAHLSLTLPTLTSFIIALLFLGRFNRTTTDISSLTPGLDVLVVRLGIEIKGLRKTWTALDNFLGALTSPL